MPLMTTLNIATPHLLLIVECPGFPHTCLSVVTVLARLQVLTDQVETGLRVMCNIAIAWHL